MAFLNKEHRHTNTNSSMCVHVCTYSQTTKKSNLEGRRIKGRKEYRNLLNESKLEYAKF